MLVEALPEAHLLTFQTAPFLREKASQEIVYGKVLLPGADAKVTYHSERGLYYLTYTQHNSSEIFLLSSPTLLGLPDSKPMLVDTGLSQPWAPKIVHYPDMDVIYCSVCQKPKYRRSHFIEAWYRMDGEAQFTRYGPINSNSKFRWLIDLDVTKYTDNFYMASCSIQTESKRNLPQEVSVARMRDPFTIDGIEEGIIPRPDNLPLDLPLVGEGGFIFNNRNGGLRMAIARGGSWNGSYLTYVYDYSEISGKWIPGPKPVLRTDGSILGIGHGSVLLAEECGPDLTGDCFVATGNFRGKTRWNDRVIFVLPLENADNNFWGIFGIKPETTDRTAIQSASARELVFGRV